MSGRRRHDGWDDGRLDAHDDGRDTWSDEGIGEWDDQAAETVEAADQSRKSAGGAAGAYVRGASPGKAYAAPDFPSFQAVDGSPGADRHGNDPGRAGQRRPAGEHAPGNYGPGAPLAAGNRDVGPRDATYAVNRPGYQSAGYGRNGGNGNSAGRQEPAGYDAHGSADGAAGWYRQAANGSGARVNDRGYSGGYDGANSRGPVPEFMPIDNDESEDERSSASRPYGRLSIYTLHEDKTREFDRLAERAAEGVRTAEPDTLVYVLNLVPKAPQQRIIYEIYRNRAAFMSHEQQPHIRQFAADRASCVVATNIIDLRLKYAKVAALGSPAGPPAQVPATQGKTQQQAGWGARGAATQHSPTPYPPVPTPQHSSAQPQGTGTRVASFTPAADSKQYPTVGRNQYPTVGRDGHSPAPQYGNSGSGAYGAGNAQYGAANSNGYSGAAGYADGSSYSSSGYSSSTGNPGTNGYQSASGGYAGTDGYSNRNGQQSASRGNDANGYGSGYPNSAVNSGGYAGNAAPSYSASASTQYAPRYRELTNDAASDADADGQQRSTDRHQDDDRQSGVPQSSEWEPRTQGYR